MAAQVAGIVVPTLGKRVEWLKDTLRSIHGPEVFVAVVAPRDVLVPLQFVDKVIRRDRSGGDLAASINAGVKALPSTIEFVTWLNDDDILSKSALRFGLKTLRSFPNISFVYGRCTYVDTFLNPLWVNRSGLLAGATQWIGPNLVPQPGSIIRRASWDAVGGIDEDLHFAFDLDLFLRLRRTGRPKFEKRIEAVVRWHPDALSNQHRVLQVKEAELVRLRNGGGIGRHFIRILAPCVRWLTLRAPSILMDSRKN
jgi:GT2 family glycosyltransferase